MDRVKTGIPFQDLLDIFRDFPLEGLGRDGPEGIHPGSHGRHGLLAFPKKFRNQKGHMPGLEESLISGGIDQKLLVAVGNGIGKKKGQNR